MCKIEHGGPILERAATTGSDAGGATGTGNRCCSLFRSILSLSLTNFSFCCVSCVSPHTCPAHRHVMGKNNGATIAHHRCFISPYPYASPAALLFQEEAAQLTVQELLPAQLDTVAQCTADAFCNSMLSSCSAHGAAAPLAGSNTSDPFAAMKAAPSLQQVPPGGGCAPLALHEAHDDSDVTWLPAHADALSLG